MAPSHTVNLGPRVAALNLGTLLADMVGWLRVPRAAWGANAPLFERPIAVPVQSALIWLPGATILVDACDPAGLAELEPTPPGERPASRSYGPAGGAGPAPRRREPRRRYAPARRPLHVA